MIMHDVGVSLLSIVAGYWVLERASSHKGELQRVGKLLGSIVIMTGLIGVGCVVVSMAGSLGGCGMGASPMGKQAMAGRYLPFAARVKPDMMPAVPTPAAQQKTQKER